MFDFHFDYSTTQWVNSIVIGVCLTKIYSTIAYHIRYREQTIFYFPYLIFLGQLIFTLIFIWYGYTPNYYPVLEGNNVLFAMAVLADSIAIIFVLSALPDCQPLTEKKLDLKDFYYKNKKPWNIVHMIWLSIILVCFYFTPNKELVFAQRLSMQVMIPLFYGSMLVGILLGIAMVVYNSDYLHTGYHLFWFFYFFLPSMGLI